MSIDLKRFDKLKPNFHDLMRGPGDCIVLLSQRREGEQKLTAQVLIINGIRQNKTELDRIRRY